METGISKNENSSGIHFTHILLFLFALLFIPLAIYAYSVLTSRGKPAIEASLIAEPDSIQVFDANKGFNKKSYSQISIDIKNNSELDYNGLRLYIPVAIFSIAGPGDSGVVARKVSWDQEGFRKTERKFLVLVLPDIKAKKRNKIELFSYYSKVSTSAKLQAEIRTKDGATYIAKPAIIIIN